MQKYKNAHDKLVSARVKMLFKQPFFGNIACRLKLVDATDQGWCNTAAVDGRNFYYNSDFVMKLDMDETVFLKSGIWLAIIKSTGCWFVKTSVVLLIK